MIGFSIAVGVFLILAILLLIFRLHTLMSVVKKSDEKVGSGSNKTNAMLFMVFLVLGFILLFWYSIKNFDVYQIPIASEHGVITDRLFWITMGITGVVFIITQILLFYFSYKYQHNPDRSALFFPENNKLEMIWTIVPAIVLTSLVVYGLVVWNKVMAPAPQNSEVVEILGYQFAWKVRYPGKDETLGAYDFRKVDATNEFGLDFSDRATYDDFTPRELHLPKGQPVEFRIRARDVLHSVFAPHFRLKMDAVPGMPTRFWFVPTKTTAEMRIETGNPDFNYEIACTEVCGRGHFSMRLLVVVEEPEAYEKWKSEQEPWLSKNPEYLTQVPDNLKEVAMIKSQIETTTLNRR
ncbi:MAG: cytochrome c oxidase subunit II [Cytophagales bacterium]|nr:cytochrome c oxidase subunit II [Cytophagales bacterium]